MPQCVKSIEGQPGVAADVGGCQEDRIGQRVPFKDGVGFGRVVAISVVKGDDDFLAEVFPSLQTIEEFAQRDNRVAPFQHTHVAIEFGAR